MNSRSSSDRAIGKSSSGRAVGKSWAPSAVALVAFKPNGDIA